MKNVDQVSTYAIYVNSFSKTYKNPQPYDLGKSNSKVYDDITRKNFSSPSCSTWKKEKKRKKKDNKLQLISYVHFESDTRHIFIPDQRRASLYLLYEQKRKRGRERERREKDSTNSNQTSSRYSSRLYIQEHACAALLTLVHPSVSDPTASRITRTTSPPLIDIFHFLLHLPWKSVSFFYICIYVFYVCIYTGWTEIRSTTEQGVSKNKKKFGITFFLPGALFQH